MGNSSKSIANSRSASVSSRWQSFSVPSCDDALSNRRIVDRLGQIVGPAGLSQARRLIPHRQPAAEAAPVPRPYADPPTKLQTLDKDFAWHQSIVEDRISGCQAKAAYAANFLIRFLSV